MADRTLDKNGIPQPFDEAERQTAMEAYIRANDVEKIGVLGKYPWLAGLDWPKYQPKPAN